MTLRDKIGNWESELEKVREARADALAKYNKKEKELLKKIEDANIQIETESNKAVGDIVREMYGELTEENILRFKNFMENSMKNTSDITRGI